MNATTLLNNARTTLHDHQDPDGPAVYAALLIAVHLAEHTAAATPDHAAACAWDFCALALNETLQTLSSPSRDRVAVSIDHDAITDSSLDAITEGIRALIGQLTHLFRHASTDPSEPAQRRHAWTGAASRLDRAAAEMP